MYKYITMILHIILILIRILTLGTVGDFRIVNELIK